MAIHFHKIQQRYVQQRGSNRALFSNRWMLLVAWICTGSNLRLRAYFSWPWLRQTATENGDRSAMMPLVDLLLRRTCQEVSLGERVCMSPCPTPNSTATHWILKHVARGNQKSLSKVLLRCMRWLASPVRRALLAGTWDVVEIVVVAFWFLLRLNKQLQLLIVKLVLLTPGNLRLVWICTHFRHQKLSSNAEQKARAYAKVGPQRFRQVLLGSKRAGGFLPRQQPVHKWLEGWADSESQRFPQWQWTCKESRFKGWQSRSSGQCRPWWTKAQHSCEELQQWCDHAIFLPKALRTGVPFQWISSPIQQGCPCWPADYLWWSCERLEGGRGAGLIWKENVSLKSWAVVCGIWGSFSELSTVNIISCSWFCVRRNAARASKRSASSLSTTSLLVTISQQTRVAVERKWWMRGRQFVPWPHRDELTQVPFNKTLATLGNGSSSQEHVDAANETGENRGK